MLQFLTKRVKYAIAYLLLFAFCLCQGAQAADDISRNSLFSNDYRMNPRDTRKYGDYFREQFLLHATENEGWVDVELTKIDRLPGGPQASTRDPSLEERVEEAWSISREGVEEEKRGGIRHYTKRVLCRVRSDVVVPARANFLKNPGRQYRIMVQGVEIAPDYSRVFNVNAGDALEKVEQEFWEFYRRAEGMDREAIYYGMILTLRSLNEAQRLPARIPVSLLRSEIGRYAIQQPFLDKPRPVYLHRFGPLADAQGLNRAFDTDLSSRPSDGRTREEKFGQDKKLFSSSSDAWNRAEQIKPDHFKDQVFQQKSATDYQKQYFQDLNDPMTKKKESLGQRIEPLVGSEQYYSAAYTADLENYKMLTGSSESALSARTGDKK